MTVEYPHYESHREALVAVLATLDSMRMAEGWRMSNLAWKTAEGIRRSFPGEFDR